MTYPDPYPVVDPRGDLTPVVDVSFYDVEVRISRLNLEDPQPPGYRYRLPLAVEYDPWVERRDMVVPEEAYKPWRPGYGGSFPLPDPRFQGISHYEAGLWHHVGGSVYCWCGDPPDSDDDRVIRGSPWYSSARDVREAHQDGLSPFLFFYANLGYRVVRGPVA